jgi:hypothetical protein
LRPLDNVEIEAVSVLDNRHRLARCPDEAPSAAGTIA